MSANPSALLSADAESSSAARKRWEAGMNVGVDQVILDETRMDKVGYRSNCWRCVVGWPTGRYGHRSQLSRALGASRARDVRVY